MSDHTVETYCHVNNKCIVVNGVIQIGDDDRVGTAVDLCSFEVYTVLPFFQALILIPCGHIHLLGQVCL